MGWKTYCKIVTALEKTIEIQSKIDGIYNDEDIILFDEN